MQRMSQMSSANRVNALHAIVRPVFEFVESHVQDFSTSYLARHPEPLDYLVLCQGARLCNDTLVIRGRTVVLSWLQPW